jgi:hypothetical protein
MSNQQPTLGHDPALTPVIPDRLAAALPEAVRSALVLMPQDKQDEFLCAFRRRSADLRLAYLSSLVYCHYGLLGRWTMTGWMWLSVFVASAVGLVWWLIDLVRLPEMVREHNHRVAADILGKLSVAPAEPTQPASS